MSVFILLFLQLFFFQTKSKYFVKGGIKHQRNAKSQFECWKIFPVFDSHNSLTRDPGFVGQFLLRHLTGMKPQRADVVTDVALLHVRSPFCNKLILQFPKSRKQVIQTTSAAETLLPVSFPWQVNPWPCQSRP